MEVELDVGSSGGSSGGASDDDVDEVLPLGSSWVEEVLVEVGSSEVDDEELAVWDPVSLVEVVSLDVGSWLEDEVEALGLVDEDVVGDCVVEVAVVLVPIDDEVEDVAATGGAEDGDGLGEAGALVEPLLDEDCWGGA